MGGQKQYNKLGGFSQYLYHQVGDTIEADGVKAKVIEKIGSPHAGLPYYANTSEAYLKLNEFGVVEQMRIYEGRTVAKDFDFGHSHTNKDGHQYIKGVVHVQEYINGKRESEARYMNNEEIKKYGALLKKANTNIKLRP